MDTINTAHPLKRLAQWILRKELEQAQKIAQWSARKESELQDAKHDLDKLSAALHDQSRSLSALQRQYNDRVSAFEQQRRLAKHQLSVMKTMKKVLDSECR